jgi:hypothetical protein
VAWTHHRTTTWYPCVKEPSPPVLGKSERNSIRKKRRKGKGPKTKGKKQVGKGRKRRSKKATGKKRKAKKKRSRKSKKKSKKVAT